MKSKMIFVTFVAIFFVGCAGNTPSIDSVSPNVSVDNDIPSNEDPYLKWKKEQEGAGKLGDEARQMNKEVEDVLKSVGTY